MNGTSHRVFAVFAALLLSAASIQLRAATFSDANWISMGGYPGVDGDVGSAATDSSGNLYIGGRFTIAGEVFAANIAKWNGTNWSALGSGINGGVWALLVSGNDLYAGGQFTTAGGVPATNIAKWNGTNWSPLGSGINLIVAQPYHAGYVQALAMSGADLYAAGYFTNASGVSANHIAKWNGSSWSALGSGMDFIVQALTVSGSNVFAGGDFSSADGTPASFIAKWNGSSWNPLGSGLDAPVYALAVIGNDVYAGGYFETAGGVSATNVARWDGTNWSAMASGIEALVSAYPYGAVNALVASGSELYAAGNYTFDSADDNRVAKWNGTNWSAVGSDLEVYALAVSGSALYAGGPIGILKWNGSDWRALSSGIYGGVSALAVSGSNVYAGGFGVVATGDGVAHHVARWSGGNWSAMGASLGNVRALAVSGNDLYAGGDFHHVAKWNGSSWSQLGSALGGSSIYVAALAVSGAEIYAGGAFETAGGVPARNVAKWNGSSWSALGTGLGGSTFPPPSVYALAVSGSDVYVGGRFTMAGGAPANYIAKWNGTNWSALGSGMSGPQYFTTVYALAVLGGDLYAGGVFTHAGGIPVNRIAKWNGSGWSALGSGMSAANGANVEALAVSGSDLYAAGNFTSAGGVPAYHIAKWDGSSWSPLGSGMNDFSTALAVSGNDLYVGGYFEAAGGKVSVHMARAVLGDAPGHNQLAGSRLSGGPMQFSYIGYPATKYALDRASNLVAPISWTGQETNTMTVSGVLMFTNTPAPGTNNFWRVRAVP